MHLSRSQATRYVSALLTCANWLTIRLTDRACKIIRDQKLRDEAITRVEFVSLVHAFFKARAWTVPPSRNAPAVPEDSQNEFDFDLDLNDPTILAALDGSETPPVSDYKELDKRIVGVSRDAVSSLMLAHHSLSLWNCCFGESSTCARVSFMHILLWPPLIRGSKHGQHVLPSLLMFSLGLR